MNEKRFMVTANRVDNGDTITGYYLKSGECAFVWVEPEDGKRTITDSSIEVDPATIEPVAMPVKNQDYDYGRCPNCENEVSYDSAEYDQPQYCYWCGQRISWAAIERTNGDE